MSKQTPRGTGSKSTANLQSAGAILAAMIVLAGLSGLAIAATAAPVVSGVSPTSGGANGGTTVTLTGTGFETGAVVEIGGIQAKGIDVVSSTEIKFVTPANAALGAKDIKVTNPNTISTTFVSAFTYQAVPAVDVTGISPINGPSNGGTVVTITGTGFSTVNWPTVTFGAKEAVLVTVSATSINAIAPPQAAAVVTVTVTNPDTTTDAAATSFTYLDSTNPTLTGHSPISGTTNGGTLVTITGTGFKPGAKVTFGSVGDSAAVTYVSDTQLTAVAPKHTTVSAEQLKVTNPDGDETGTVTYTYTAPSTALSIATISPAAGPEHGGTKVTITGTGFHSSLKASDVTFGGSAALELTVLSSTSLQAVTPAGTAAPSNVQVTNPNGAMATTTFSYESEMRITSVSPPTLATKGGTTFTISGEGFPSTVAASQSIEVSFGSVKASAGLCSVTTAPTIITCTAPPATSSGPKDIVVTNLVDGRSARISGALTYVLSPAPTVSDTTVDAGDAISRSNGVGAGGADSGGRLTITGTGFAAVDGHKPTVKLGTVDVASSAITAVTDTSIEVNVPARSLTSATNVAVRVTNPDGQISAEPSCPAGTTVDIEAGCLRILVDTKPNGPLTTSTEDVVTIVGTPSGTSNGGATVTVSGESFAEGAKVTFGSVLVPAADTKFLSSTSIEVKVPALSGMTPAATTDVRVFVTNPDTQKSSSVACGAGSPAVGCYRYTGAPSPGYVSLTSDGGDTSGPAIGGETITVTGSGFATASAEKPTVLFGGITVNPDDVTVVSSTSLTFLAPGGPAGSVSLVITNPDGKSTGTASGAYTYTSSAAPTIADVAPNTGPSTGGSPITITGTGFGKTASASRPTITVGGVAATLCEGAATPHRLCTTAPISTSLEVITPAANAGLAIVTVTNQDGQAASRSGDYRLLAAAHSITSLSPASATDNGGGTLTVTGTGLPVNNPSVVLGSHTAVITGTPSAIAIGAKIAKCDGCTPPSGGTKVDTHVSDVYGQTTTFVNGFTYTPSPVPTLTSVSPILAGVNGGTEITITGQNFVAGATVSVEVGGNAKAAAVSDIAANGKTLKFIAPAHALGPAKVTVINANGDSLVIPAAYGYLAVVNPSISSVTPSAGPVAGGTTVTITGANFQTGATVHFGTVAATVNSVSGTSITAVSPAATSPGAVAVKVTNPDNQAGTLASAFTYTANTPPSITSISPTTGPSLGGTTVTITGTDFSTGVTVKFGGTDATVSASSETSITVTTPAHAAGAVDVVVTNSDGQIDTEAGGFTYTASPAPTITSIAPAVGTANGGTSATITGTNFATGVTVTIGGVAATSVVRASATSITLVTPAGTAGTADVVVTNPDSQAATLAAGFTYEAAPAPSATSLSPTTGTGAGGTTVTITGTNFATGATVTFGGASGSSPSVNAAGTQITVTTPAHAAGVVDVVVRNPDAQTSTLADAFTYTAVDTGPSDTEIAAGNALILASMEVHRHGDDNEIHWSLDGISPTPAGVQIWRSLSPFNLLVTLTGADATAGEYTDEDAPADALYIITVFFADGKGQVTSLTNAPGYVGLSDDELDAKASQAGAEESDDFPWWAWLLIALGILLIVLLVIGIIVAARRRDDGPRSDAYNWDDEGEADDTWAAPAQQEPREAREGAFHIECPRCEHEFTAHGEKPLHTTCPNCGVAGVLR